MLIICSALCHLSYSNHGIFKSILFLLCGSLIHVQHNFQSIFMIRSSSIFIKCSFILSSLLLILSLSKEGIIHSSLYNFTSSFIFSIYIIGGLLTCFYSIGFYIYVFMIFNFGLYYDYYYYSGFIFMIYVMCCIYIDQSFELCFLLSSLYIWFYIFNFECLFSYSLFYILGSSLSLVFYMLFFIFIIMLFFIVFYIDYSMIRIYIFSYLWIMNYCFDSRSSFLFSQYYWMLWMLSFFIFSWFIYIIELIAGFKSYSLLLLLYRILCSFVIGCCALGVMVIIF